MQEALQIAAAVGPLLAIAATAGGLRARLDRIERLCEATDRRLGQVELQTARHAEKLAHLEDRD